MNHRLQRGVQSVGGYIHDKQFAPPSGSAEGVQFDNVGIGPHQPLNRAQAIASQFLDGPLQLGTRLAQRAQTISERRADRGQRQARQGDLRGEGRCEQDQAGTQKGKNSHRCLVHRRKRIKHG